ncbi:MAG TPA: BsuPI-related putative proteinase inhibitor [Chthonomonadaceae bacterium]|nr:BsuPI-related putative proteinase inhibitor [Chthonomonadaceae bacterium]
MFSIWKSMAVFGLILLPLAGCGGGGGGEAPSTQTTRGAYQGVEFTATTRTTFKLGEAVAVTLVVTNTNSQPFTFDYGGCAENEALVQQQGQSLTFFDSTPPGTYCGGVVKHATLAPGETLTFTQVWNQQILPKAAGQTSSQVPPGQYQIVSGLATEINGTIPSAAPLTITIQPHADPM